jgi:acyl carrier protein
MPCDPASGPTRKTQIIEAVWNVYIETVTEPTIPETDARQQIRLFGANAKLDSLGLVTLLLDIEQEINDQFDALISLVDERAMSQTKSPFRTIGTLTDYIEKLIEEQYGSIEIA